MKAYAFVLIAALPIAASAADALPLPKSVVIDRSTQGPGGPVFPSKSFRTAVPDLRVEVEEMLIVGDRVIGRLRFTGHFTGTFGSGAAARQGGRIAENWHREDNLTLLQQLGVVGR